MGKLEIGFVLFPEGIGLCGGCQEAETLGSEEWLSKKESPEFLFPALSQVCPEPQKHQPAV